MNEPDSDGRVRINVPLGVPFDRVQRAAQQLNEIIAKFKDEHGRGPTKAELYRLSEEYDDD